MSGSNGYSNGSYGSHGSNGFAMELRGVTKRYGSVTAVDRVDLQIRDGEFLTLLGPSGCGKTTILRLLSGFEVPDAGSVVLSGGDVSHVPPHKRDVNQVFQSYALFPHLTVEGNVGFGLRMRGVGSAEIKTRVKDALDLVALDGLGGRRTSELSGGQRQRVALARALVCRPKVLLLDEPLSALDAKLREMMQIELKRIQQRLGITFVFVTHDQEEALTMSDRIAVVNNGRIEQIDAADEIYEHPATAFAADFVGAANLVRGEVLSVRNGQCEARIGEGAVVMFRGEDIAADCADVLLSIRPEKIHLSDSSEGLMGAFPGAIEDVIFRGAFAELRILLEGGSALRASVANASAHRRSWRKGDRVWCSVHHDDIVVVDRH